MTWVVIRWQEQLVIGFTYHDQAAGLSAQGTVVRPESLKEDARRAAEQPDLIIRLSSGERAHVGLGMFPAGPLGAIAIAELGLPVEPDWIRFYPQPVSTPWRDDPTLHGRFHPAYPDDLQVAFFFEHGSERMWVRVKAVEPEIDGYVGELLDTPFDTSASLTPGADVVFRVAKASPTPIWIGPVVRANLQEWSSACVSCGFDLLLERAETLLDRQFKQEARVVFDSFTTRCRMCGQTMLVRRRS